MTDFWSRQDSARRRTHLLVALFIGNTFFIGLAIYYVFYFLLKFNCTREKYTGEALCVDVAQHGVFQLETFLYVMIPVTLAFLYGTLSRLFMMRGGGEPVALKMGARPVNGDGETPEEQVFVNILQEMSIAAGVQPPKAYILDGELHINAFAAGYSPEDAVVCVSRGALDHLTREELQAVVGHEMSHVLNGDMKLAMRLIAGTYGMLAIYEIGQAIMRSSSRSSNKKGGDGGLGLVMVIGGLIGFILAMITKMAVSRQREELADASATQFTRNPLALASALKKIGGQSTPDTAPNDSKEFSHLYFTEDKISGFFGWFRTHPSLEKRILALDPVFDGHYPHVEIAEHDEDFAFPKKAEKNINGVSDETIKAERPKFVRGGLILMAILGCLFVVSGLMYFFDVMPENVAVHKVDIAQERTAEENEASATHRAISDLYTRVNADEALNDLYMDDINSVYNDLIPKGFGYGRTNNIDPGKVRAAEDGISPDIHYAIAHVDLHEKNLDSALENYLIACRGGYRGACGKMAQVGLYQATGSMSTSLADTTKYLDYASEGIIEAMDSSTVESVEYRLELVGIRERLPMGFATRTSN